MVRCIQHIRDCKQYDTTSDVYRCLSVLHAFNVYQLQFDQPCRCEEWKGVVLELHPLRSLARLPRPHLPLLAHSPLNAAPHAAAITTADTPHSSTHLLVRLVTSHSCSRSPCLARCSLVALIRSLLLSLASLLVSSVRRHVAQCDAAPPPPSTRPARSPHSLISLAVLAFFLFPSAISLPPPAAWQGATCDRSQPDCNTPTSVGLHRLSRLQRPALVVCVASHAQHSGGCCFHALHRC